MNKFGFAGARIETTSIRRGLSILASCASLLIGFHASARPLDVWAEVAMQVGVPVAVLHGIALTESGKVWSDGATRPWPWTLNSPVNGPQYFPNREAAEVQLRALRAAGVRNIDIGIMQINCGYHCSRVTSPEALLDPNTNIRIAGQILAEVRSVAGDLAATVGAYHAGLSPSRAARSKWYQDAVAERVRKLRKGSPA